MEGGLKIMNELGHRIAFATTAIFLFGAMGCTASASITPQPVTPAPAPVVEKSLETIYNEAIDDSAVVSPGEELDLSPLKADADGTFTVTTWAGCRGDGAPNKCGAYVAQGSVTLKWDVWVTANDEVRKKCQASGVDVILRVNQALGLPAPKEPLPADTMERQFVTFAGVPAANIFRPCLDPRVDTTRCSGTKLLDELPKNAPPDFYKWFTNQGMSSWQISPAGQPPAGFPWTRLGYTYDWSPGSTNHYGASEYVIPGKSTNVTVKVVAVQTAKEYCKPQ